MADRWEADDLVVIIPTRDRWAILDRTPAGRGTDWHPKLEY